MNKLIAVAVALMLSCPLAFAGTQQDKMKTCNAEAGKKSLAGDERKAFMKGCLSADAPAPAAGAVQQDKMKTCNADAGKKALKGDERKAFMKDCLSAK
ncbi:MAG TPA: PsiF family protein [Methylophilaceae bacterium]|nr:PsiF family protein [Methylophilaceae bacterium]